MRLAVVDDMANDRLELIDRLHGYFASRRADAEYVEFSSADELLDSFESNDFDVIFLDIYMNEINGIEAARRIRDKDARCRLVFVTSSAAHAVESYTVQANFYLTKPLDDSRVNQAMDIVCAELVRDVRYIEVHVGHVPAKIRLKDILWSECAGERPMLHLEDRALRLDETVTSIFTQLIEDERFLSCNRNVAVNMDWIASVGDSDFMLQNGEAVPIRQRGRAAVKREFLSYSLKALREE